MRNKIFTILGIVILTIAIGAYFLFDSSIKQSSNAMGSNIMVAKTNIADGTVIKDTTQAKDLFMAKRTNQSDIVPSAIQVTVEKEIRKGNIFTTIGDFLNPTSYQMSESSYKDLVGKKVMGNIYKNEQVLGIDLSSDSVAVSDTERYFAVSTDFVSSVGAEIKEGDYVDLWIHYTDNKSAKAGVSENVMGPLKVIKIKDESNVEIKDTASNKIPKLVIFKMTEDQIVVANEKAYEGNLFLTKWGVSPNSKAQLKTVESTNTQTTKIADGNTQ